MGQVNSPGEDDGFGGVHAVGDGGIAGDVGIAGEEGGTFECITRGELPPAATVYIFHQVKAPRHGQDRAETCQHGDEGAGLDRPGVDQIWLDAFDDAAQSTHILGYITPAEDALAAFPKYLFNFLRHGAVFGLARSALQAHIINLVFRLSQSGEEAMVVGGVVDGEVDEFHVFLSAGCEVWSALILFGHGAFEGADDGFGFASLFIIGLKLFLRNVAYI